MRLLLFLTIILTACNSSSTSAEATQEKTSQDSSSGPTASKQRPQAESNIATIRAEYQRINSLKPDSTRFAFLCDEQTKVIVLKEDGSTIKVMVDWGWVGDASTREEWYYQNGQLIFRYVRTEGGVGDQPNTVHEARTYVKDNKVIRYLQDDREVPCNNCQIKPSAKEYTVLKVSTNDEAKAALCR